MQINKKPLVQVLQQIKASQQYPEHLEAWINGVEKQNYVAPFTFLEEIETYLATLEETVDFLSIFPKWTNENNAHCGTLIALTTYLLKTLPLATATETVHIQGDYTINQPTLIEGDLVVEGNLSISYIPNNAIGLVVLGDVTIKGNYLIDSGVLVVFGKVTVEGALEESSEWSLNIIGEDLTVHHYLSSAGELLVGGQTTSPFIYVHYNHGFSIFKKGFAALYFHEMDHGRSLCFGTYEAQFIRIDEIIGVKALPPEENYKNLQKIMQEEVLGALATADLDNYDQEQYDLEDYLEEELDIDPFELSDDFLAAFEEGKAVFKPAVLEEWAKNNLS